MIKNTELICDGCEKQLTDHGVAITIFESYRLGATTKDYCGYCAMEEDKSLMTFEAVWYEEENVME